MYFSFSSSRRVESSVLQVSTMSERESGLGEEKVREGRKNAILCSHNGTYFPLSIYILFFQANWIMLIAQILYARHLVTHINTHTAFKHTYITHIFPLFCLSLKRIFLPFGLSAANSTAFKHSQITREPRTVHGYGFSGPRFAQKPTGKLIFRWKNHERLANFTRKTILLVRRRRSKERLSRWYARVDGAEREKARNLAPST